MKTLKKQYRDLEMRVLSELRDKINNSDIYSDHVQEKCIKVNVFDYTELSIINDRLMFLDDKGSHYDIFNGDCDLEDFIDILSN